MGLTVAVTGMPGSGKSLVARVIAGELGAPLYSMGDVVRREVARRGLMLTVENVERVAAQLRGELGPAAVALLLYEEVKGVEGPLVVDGLRSLEEARILSGRGPLCIVAVHASPSTRYRRLLARGRVDEVRGWGDLAYRDAMNLEFGVGAAIALADYMIVNEGSLEEAVESARIVAGRIRGDGGSSCSGGGGKADGEPREG